MEKLKNTIKQVINFIKKYWFLFAMGVGILLLIMMRASAGGRRSDTDDLLDKSEEVKKKNQDKIKEAEQAIKEAKKANEEIKARQAKRAKDKDARDSRANDIFNIGNNDD